MMVVWLPLQWKIIAGQATMQVSLLLLLLLLLLRPPKNSLLARQWDHLGKEATML